MHPDKLFLLERNRGWTVLTDLRAPARLALAPLFAFTELLMWGYCLLRGPAFLRAKARTYRWLGSHRPELRARRRFVEGLRERSDWQVLSSCAGTTPGASSSPSAASAGSASETGSLPRASGQPPALSCR